MEPTHKPTKIRRIDDESAKAKHVSSQGSIIPTRKIREKLEKAQEQREQMWGKLEQVQKELEQAQERGEQMRERLDQAQKEQKVTKKELEQMLNTMKMLWEIKHARSTFHGNDTVQGHASSRRFLNTIVRWGGSMEEILRQFGKDVMSDMTAYESNEMWVHDQESDFSGVLVDSARWKNATGYIAARTQGEGSFGIYVLISAVGSGVSIQDHLMTVDGPNMILDSIRLIPILMKWNKDAAEDSPKGQIARDAIAIAQFLFERAFLPTGQWSEVYKDGDEDIKSPAVFPIDPRSNLYGLCLLGGGEFVAVILLDKGQGQVISNSIPKNCDHTELLNIYQGMVTEFQLVKQDYHPSTSKDEYPFQTVCGFLELEGTSFELVSWGGEEKVWITRGSSDNHSLRGSPSSTQSENQGTLSGNQLMIRQIPSPWSQGGLMLSPWTSSWNPSPTSYSYSILSEPDDETTLPTQSQYDWSEAGRDALNQTPSSGTHQVSQDSFLTSPNVVGMNLSLLDDLLSTKAVDQIMHAIKNPSVPVSIPVSMPNKCNYTNQKG